MITKEMIEAAMKSAPQFWRDTDNFDKHISKMLTAALAAMPGPAMKVKPLEWDEPRCGPDEYAKEIMSAIREHAARGRT